MEDIALALFLLHSHLLFVGAVDQRAVDGRGGGNAAAWKQYVKKYLL